MTECRIKFSRLGVNEYSFKGINCITRIESPEIIVVTPIWTRISDSLPILYGKYLVYTKSKCNFTAIFMKNRFFIDNDQEDDQIITHWMELPKLPEET